MRRLLATAVIAFAAAPALVRPATLTAQDPVPAAADTAGAFLDRGAAALLNRARETRLQSDRSIRSYTALVTTRMAAGMRMPLKDRTLFRQETAARVRWSRDDASIVQVIAGRAQHPGGVEPTWSGPGLDQLFDPAGDRMYFGFTSTRRDGAGDNDDYWIEHPLGEIAERHYRYQSGDTMTIRLQDGRAVRVIELRVIPRRNDPHTLRGMLWIDAASGALVQAAFRLARTVDIVRDLNALDDDDREAMRYVPGFLKPFEFDVTLMTVEYSLWDLRHWLPRTMRFEGYARTGALRFPASFDMSYRINDVVSDDDSNAPPEAEAVRVALAEWGETADHRQINRRQSRRRIHILVPQDTAKLLESPDLPPPIWRDASGFATESELKSFYDRLASITGPTHTDLPISFGWGLGEPDMLRYNRVEALSVGARVSAPLPVAQLSAVARFGLGDMHPNVAFDARRETMRRTLQLRLFHELTTFDESRRALGFGNTMSSLVLGRDEGEYYRATGASLNWSPPQSRRHAFDVRVYAEDQRDVARETHIALPRLWNDSVFRETVPADRAFQYGSLVHIRPWWGSDPARAQFGADLLVQAEAGDFEHVRGRLTLRSAFPLAAGVRIGAEAAVGTADGDVPRQRMFYLGGASTLRGYEPSTVSGTSMARGRLELARAFPSANLALFSDWGWAGDRDDIRRDNQRWSVGAGASLLDGLIRVDLAHGLRAPRGWRLDLHMDAIL